MKSSENPKYVLLIRLLQWLRKMQIFHHGEGVSISVDGLSGDSGNSIYLERMIHKRRRETAPMYTRKENMEGWRSSM